MKRDNPPPGTADHPAAIPSRYETLEVLWLMGRYAPVIMLRGDADGHGARWTIHGAEVQPGIARYLMEHGYLADSGPTELGARMLNLTDEGIRFRDDGTAWWNSLGILKRLRIRCFG